MNQKYPLIEKIAFVILLFLLAISLASCSARLADRIVDGARTPDPTPAMKNVLLPVQTPVTDPTFEPVHGIWIGQSLYAPDAPERFRLTYDRALWTLVTMEALPELHSITLAGCLVRPAAGMGLPPELSVEKSTKQVGQLSYQTNAVSRGSEMLFVKYFTGESYFVGFMVAFESAPLDCLHAAEQVLGTLAIINP